MHDSPDGGGHFALASSILLEDGDTGWNLDPAEDVVPNTVNLNSRLQRPVAQRPDANPPQRVRHQQQHQDSPVHGPSAAGIPLSGGPAFSGTVGGGYPAFNFGPGLTPQNLNAQWDFRTQLGGAPLGNASGDEKDFLQLAQAAEFSRSSHDPTGVSPLLMQAAQMSRSSNKGSLKLPGTNTRGDGHSQSPAPIGRDRNVSPANTVNTPSSVGATQIPRTPSPVTPVYQWNEPKKISLRSDSPDDSANASSAAFKTILGGEKQSWKAEEITRDDDDLVDGCSPDPFAGGGGQFPMQGPNFLNMPFGFVPYWDPSQAAAYYNVMIQQQAAAAAAGRSGQDDKGPNNFEGGPPAAWQAMMAAGLQQMQAAMSQQAQMSGGGQQTSSGGQDEMDSSMRGPQGGMPATIPMPGAKGMDRGRDGGMDHGIDHGLDHGMNRFGHDDDMGQIFSSMQPVHGNSGGAVSSSGGFGGQRINRSGTPPERGEGDGFFKMEDRKGKGKGRDAPQNSNGVVVPPARDKVGGRDRKGKDRKGGSIEQHGEDINSNSVSGLGGKGPNGNAGPKDTGPRMPPGSPLIEQLRAQEKTLELKDLAWHIADIAQDQYGSRLIQQKLEVASEDQKQQALRAILAQMQRLTTDVFGNYVIQKFFEHGTAAQRRILAEQLVGSVLQLSLQMYGCRVVQKALEKVSLEQQMLLIGELKGHVLECVEDQHGNHVIQKCIECLPTEKLVFIVNSFNGHVDRMAKHCYGCRVIQRLIERCQPHQIASIVQEALSNSMELATDQYGNYVIQHVLERGGRPADRAAVMALIRSKIVQLSNHKYASNVVEKALSSSNTDERAALVMTMVGDQKETNPPLLALSRDRFGNYAVQRALELTNGHAKDALVQRLSELKPVLRKSNTYGKHILSALDRAIQQGNQNNQSN